MPERKEQKNNKKKKKSEVRETREGLCSRAHLDTKSKETQAPSTPEGEQDEEESNSSHTRKRAPSENTEEDQPPHALKEWCGPKLVLLDGNSDFDKESAVSEEVPKRNPRAKPPAKRYRSRDSWVLVSLVHY